MAQQLKSLYRQREFDKIQLEIESSCSDNDLEIEYNEREQFEQEYYKLSLRISNILDQFKEIVHDAPALVTPVDNCESLKHLQNVKLPTIKLPTFSGSYLHWLEFKDSFMSLIHSNDKLSNVHKFQYLKASLEGNALQTIASIEVSNSNYTIAWNIICDRYDNNQLIVFNHLKAIFELPNCNKPCFKILRQLLDDLSKHLRSLKILKLPVDSWSVIIIYIITTKLDKETSKQWEEYKKEGVYPTMQELYAFLKQRADILETLDSREQPKCQPKYHKPYDNKSYKQVAYIAGTHKCNFCKGDHSIYHCSNFLKLDIVSRLAETKKLKLCINCLKTGHTNKFCPSGHCRYCEEKHNSLLHINTSTQVSNENSTNKVALYSNKVKNSQILLSTVKLIVTDTKGNEHSCRAVLDCGSQSNFITESLCNKLNLTKTTTNLEISGISKTISPINFKTKLTIKSCYNNFQRTINCFVLDTISEELPFFHFNKQSINIPKDLNMADSQFSDPGTIDVLLGATIFWETILDGKIKLGQNKPIMHNTEFGWVIGGNLNVSPQHSEKFICHLSTNATIQDQLQRFWETEEPGLQKSTFLTPDEVDCETYFQNTFQRDPDGRFIVGIPFKKDPTQLGESKSLAQKRFYNMERKFQSNSNLKTQYIQFMEEYISLGHMTQVNPINDVNCYYFPHHGVLREDSLTTKLRVVFDGSASTTNGWSLNDCQHTGPRIQEDLLSILIRFRQHRYVFTADITKMYRQIKIIDDHKKYQKIWWRSNTDIEPSIYELNTVTYGTTSAPYLAVRCIKQQATEYLASHPVSANRILTDFYVDDLISGTDDLDEASKICREINQIMNNACFELRKWATNDLRVLRNIPEQKQISYLQAFGDDKIKTLGLQWSSNSDMLSYKISNNYHVDKVTKRLILSLVGQIFDPLGLLTPCIIISKIILQQLWKFNLSWDDSVPSDLQTKWNQFYKSLLTLNDLTIPRHVICLNYERVELHGFCDASQQAYGACIYARSIDNEGNIFVRLWCGKSKVAPLKTISIPRLELCGALLLNRIMNKVLNSLTITTTQYFWCDSQIVLSWLKTSSNCLQTFVANRIAEIQRDTDISKWHHIRTQDNPADLASRGIQPNFLEKENLWWCGPKWLSSHKESWPQSAIQILTELPEVKKTTINHFISEKQPNELFLKYSNLKKLIRVTAWCYRFINNCKQKRNSSETLTVLELDSAFKTLITLSQSECFSEEIDLLRKNKNIKLKSRLISLSPFLDKDQYLRVGGRLRNSQLHYENQHQLLLSSKHPLASLIVEQEHIQLMHAGPQMLLSSIRERFWIINGRNLTKRIVHNCKKCFRANPKSLTQFMGDLPSHRVQRSYPFQISGTDYAGPFLIRPSKGRGIKRLKCYICIFVCLATKAVHLELVTDLTTSSFFATLNRFISRRGKPSFIYSDNGSNFVGASNELSKLYKFLTDNENPIYKELANHSIVWKFNPAFSPNFGGLWEAVVKSIKFHLKRVLNDICVTYEEFVTVLTGIEAILNSRPISAMSSDPNDLEPLTPAHFVIGRKLTSIPSMDVTLKSAQGINFTYLKQLQDNFWTRWSKEYLSELQHRRKWFVKTPIAIGTLVLLKEDNVSSLRWKLGRIIELHPGEDGIVRVVTVKTTSGTFKRSLSKLCPLPFKNTDATNE